MAVGNENFVAQWVRKMQFRVIIAVINWTTVEQCRNKNCSYLFGEGKVLYRDGKLYRLWSFYFLI